MKLTTEDIIKILPIDEAMRVDLLARFASLDYEAKFEVEQIVWRSYHALYDMKLEENIQNELEKTGTSAIALDDDFYSKIRKQTEDEMAKGAYAGTTSSDLDSVRSKLKTLIG